MKLILVGLLGGAVGFAAGTGLSNIVSSVDACENHGVARGLVSAMVMARQHALATDADTINILIRKAGLTSQEIFGKKDELQKIGIVTMDMVR